jgi:hypothetical protein
MRLDLACQLLKKSQHEETHKLNILLQHYWTSKQQEKNTKIEKIRLDHKRGISVQVTSLFCISNIVPLNDNEREDHLSSYVSQGNTSQVAHAV